MSTQGIGLSYQGLRLLSIDGGGIRGLSSLLILKEVLYRMKQTQNLSEIPRPCDVFDLAGGTGTGGIIVILLFRLRMEIDHAIDAYIDITRYVFSERQSWPHRDGIFKASRLEDAIVKIISSRLNVDEETAKELRMLDDNGPKCFVSATTVQNMASITLFRSWIPNKHPNYNCTIVEACRATTAAIPFFKSIDIGDANLRQTYIGGVQYNNPIRYVQKEAKYTFPGHALACIVSIGAGVRNVIGQDLAENTTMLLTTLLEQIVADCETTAQEVAEEYSTKPCLYFRLNVERGLQEVGLAQWKALSAVKSHTEAYLKQSDVDQKVNQLVEALAYAAPIMVQTMPSPTELSSNQLQALDKLEKLIAVNAYHDSQARTTFSSCLPGTRQVQIASITKWIKCEKRQKPLFVVLGPAGSGKSSLLWSVAQICKDNGSYAASFFFSGADSERNSSLRLINTISYQICEALPELRPYVARVVEVESSILSRSLQSQLNTLLLRPLRQLQLDQPGISIHPRVIIIDALDECINANDQVQVLATVAEALSNESFPFLCLVSSCFNINIENLLSHPFVQPLIHSRVDLGVTEDAEKDDIRTYLNFNVGRIRDEHPFRSRIPHGWPTKSDIETIVERSGGQFIYAATVVRYIDPSHYEPHVRLQDVLTISPSQSGMNPFAALDDLYRTLMLLVERPQNAIEILGIHLVQSRSQLWLPDTLTWLSDWIKEHFEKLNAVVVLAPLASVLKYERHRIKFYHLSFAEFLLDFARSREFFVQLSKWRMWLVSHLVQLFYEDPNDISMQDINYLLKKAKPGTDLHQAINAGLELVIDHPKCLPCSGNFNIWPFVVNGFFRELHFWISLEKIATVLFRRRENCVPLTVLIQLAASHKLNNSFLLFELCRTIADLESAGFISGVEEDWDIDPDNLWLCITYLSDYLDGQKVILAEDYCSAVRHCMWYLQTPRYVVCRSLKDQLRSLTYLPVLFGIPKYLRDMSSNIYCDALEVLPSLLPQSAPLGDLLSSLSQPFNNEIYARNPLLAYRARSAIRNFLIHHDASYQAPLEETSSGKVDEPRPHFDRFLIQECKCYNLSYELLNGWDCDDAPVCHQ